MPSIVTAEQLSKTFQVKVRDPGLRGALRALFRPRYRDVHAVRDVTFRIDPGEVVAFLGPNGAGKTTTLKMLAGLLYPTGGRVEVAGFNPWTGGPPFKRRIALTKRIELVLGAGGGDGNRVTAEALAAFGAVKSFRFPNAVLEVPREDAPTTSARLLAAFSVADLSIEDPPIEEVIRLAFARGVEEEE